jgi:two-component system, cell cycle response regulator
VTPSTNSAERSKAADLVSLADRMVYMQALRVGLAGIVMLAAVLAPSLIHADIGELALSTAAYLLCSAGVEAVCRIRGTRSARTLGWMLIADGVFIAWAMYLTSGTQSPLRFLAYLHIIAVTLAASYRTGLKVALWHSLLFFVVFYAQFSGWLASTEPLSSSRFGRASVFNVLALWLVALTTATFSALNERQLRKRRDDFSALAGLAADLQSCTAPEEVGSSLIRAARGAFELQQILLLASPQGEPLLMAADPLPAITTSLSGDESIHEAMTKREPVMCKRIDPEFDPGLARLMPFGRNVALIPLVAEDETIGVAVIEFGRGLHGVERRVVSMLEQFAAHASLALRNTWLLAQVQTLASTDALTGADNRRTFQETLDHELSRARRTGEPLTLVMLDIDHFKALNDEHGHLVGDDMLQQVAAALRQESRDFDSIGRFGGEEFTVILPGCSSREALPAAERLRKAIGRIEKPTTATASAGVATYPTHCDSADGLLRAADEALYESKRAGRDRVTRSRRRPSGRARKAARAQALTDTSSS